MNRNDIDALMAVVGAENVITRDNIPDDFAHDELGDEQFFPEVLVKPGSTEEVSKVMKLAYERSIPVTPRGSGTGLCGASVCINGGIMLSTARLNGILDIDAQCLMATVEPGVILLEFQERVEKMGLFYPPDPGEKSATIGGNISTNAGGMRAVKYGVTRDYVKGLEVVLADGRIIELGGKTVKNSSGYSLLHLMVGSEGTLGIITKIVLRLLPLPKKRVSLLVPFPSLEKAIETVPKVMSGRVIPTAVEFMQRDVILASDKYLGKKFPHSEAPAYLLLLFDGSSQTELEGVYETVAEICLAEGAWDVLIADTSDRQSAIWEARGAFLEAMNAMSEIDEVDVVVPIHLIGQFIRYTEDLSRKYGMRILSFGHAGDGNCHVYILRDEIPKDRWKPMVEKCMDEMYRMGFTLGGNVSGEHGIGVAKRRFLAQKAGEDHMSIMRAIKQSFDPKGILNPGKIV